jgi:hypothetical protein
MASNLLKIIQSKDSSALAKMAGKAGHAARQERIDDRAEEIVNWLFDRLKLIFPASINTVFKDLTHEELTKRQWIIAFREQKIHSNEQLRAGLKGARASANPFFPAVGQFIDWCKTAELQNLGLMTSEQLFEDVMTYTNTKANYCESTGYPWRDHIHAYAVGRVYSKMRSESLTDRSTLIECERVIKMIARILQDGGEIPQIETKLIEDKIIPCDPKTALDAIAKIKKTIEKTRGV